MLLLISAQFSVRSVYVENALTAQASNKSCERISHEASNEMMDIRSHGTDCRRTSTSTSRKPLSRDTDNSMELYAWNVSQIQAAKEQRIFGGKTMGGVANEYDESVLSVDHIDSCWHSALVHLMFLF